MTGCGLRIDAGRLSSTSIARMCDGWFKAVTHTSQPCPLFPGSTMVRGGRCDVFCTSRLTIRGAAYEENATIRTAIYTVPPASVLDENACRWSGVFRIKIKRRKTFPHRPLRKTPSCRGNSQRTLDK